LYKSEISFLDVPLVYLNIGCMGYSNILLL